MDNNYNNHQKRNLNITLDIDSELNKDNPTSESNKNKNSILLTVSEIDNEINIDDNIEKSNCVNIKTNPNNKRRQGRQFSLYVHQNKYNNFYKLIIPYNFEKKHYFIKDKEIEFYEHKEYLTKKIEIFNKNPVFDIEFIYQAKGFKNFISYLPLILCCVLIFYITSVLIVLFCFNPIIIYILFTYFKKLLNYLVMLRFILLEKYKMKEIYCIIQNENLSEICKKNNLKWIIGQSGYWLEIQEIIE